MLLDVKHELVHSVVVVLAQRGVALCGHHVEVGREWAPEACVAR